MDRDSARVSSLSIRSMTRSIRNLTWNFVTWFSGEIELLAACGSAQQEHKYKKILGFSLKGPPLNDAAMLRCRKALLLGAANLFNSHRN